MFSIIFTLILGGVSIYLFYQNNFLAGVILLVWTISRLFGVNLQRLIRGMGELTSHSELQRKCNVLIELSLYIEEILKCPTIDVLFEKLKKEKNISEIKKDEWVKKLLENYKKSNIHGEGLEKVKFNIKNNLLWKNEKMDFIDSVYHEIFIPYEYKNGKEREEKSFLIPEIEIGLVIRIFIVNGIIKLQIGEFSKKYTPKILRDGGLAVYQTYETVTSFPLMYFSYQHKIPESYLNLSYYATESYRGLHSGQKSKDKSKNKVSDWGQLNQEIRDYSYVCNLSDEYLGDRKKDERKWDKIVNMFNEKKEQWLKKEEFKNPFGQEENTDEYDDRWDDNIIHYSNKYLSVFVFNYNELREKREKYGYTDYYEEQP